MAVLVGGAATSLYMVCWLPFGFAGLLDVHCSCELEDVSEANPSEPKALPVQDRSRTVFQMASFWGQVLMCVDWVGVQVCVDCGSIKNGCCIKKIPSIF